MYWGCCLGNPQGPQPTRAWSKGLKAQSPSERKHWAKSRWCEDWNGTDAKVWWALCAKLCVLPWGMLLMWCQRGEKETSQFSEIALEGGLTLLSRLRVCSVCLLLCNVSWMKPLDGAALFMQQVCLTNTAPLQWAQVCSGQAWVVYGGDNKWSLSSEHNLQSI